jgi:hypothetical protein
MDCFASSINSPATCAGNPQPATDTLQQPRVCTQGPHHMGSSSQNRLRYRCERKCAPYSPLCLPPRKRILPEQILRDIAHARLRNTINPYSIWFCRYIAQIGLKVSASAVIRD